MPTRIRVCGRLGRGRIHLRVYQVGLQGPVLRDRHRRVHERHVHEQRYLRGSGFELPLQLSRTMDRQVLSGQERDDDHADRHCHGTDDDQPEAEQHAVDHHRRMRRGRPLNRHRDRGGGRVHQSGSEGEELTGSEEHRASVQRILEEEDAPWEQVHQRDGGRLAGWVCITEN